MNGRRALEIFEGFHRSQLAFDAKEIDELLKAQLVVEADPRDLQALQWLETSVMELVKLPFGDPSAPAALAKELGEVDEKLKSSWSRLTTRDSKVKAQEAQRRTLRRALAMTNDRVLIDKLMAADRTRQAAATPFLKHPTLGDELYAVSHKGARVQQQLALRLDRYAEHPLAAFLKQFEKAETKMATFGGEIATLSNNIGYVKKNPHQVVIGLAKTGMPANEALATYKSAMSGAGGAPDVAVTHARNAQAHGGSTQAVAERLREARRLLRACNFPDTPEVAGAAKTLLAFPTLQEGAARFVAISNAVLGAGYTDGRLDIAVKCAARLMPAHGTPAEVVRRATLAAAAINRNQIRLTPTEHAMYATALGSMVREDAAVEPLVIRFKFLWSELARLQVHQPQANALECVGCAGTPVEVADTVRTLAYQVANKAGRPQPSGADYAVAAAFAKRFAY